MEKRGEAGIRSRSLLRTRLVVFGSDYRCVLNGE